MTTAPDIATATAAHTIHLCIATEQVLANALPARLLPWQQLVVVASDHLRGKQRSRLNQLLHWAEGEMQHRGLEPSTCLRVVELPDTHLGWGGLLAFARRLAAELMQQHPNASLDVNVTGGTKLMTQAFSTAFGEQARLVYCNTQGEGLEILDHQGDTPAQPLPPNLLTLSSYLDAQGYELQGGQFPTDPAWMQTLMQRRPLTVALVHEAERLRKTPVPGSKRLLSELHRVAAGSLPCRANATRAARTFQPEATLAAPQSDVWLELVAQLQAHEVASLVSWKGNLHTGRLTLRWHSEAAARYLAGGYLEEYAALSMAALGIPPEHWALNVRVRPRESRMPADRDYQELDLAVVWRNRMWVLECKAGQQLQNGGGGAQDILNKLDALKAHIGGSLGEAWLLTPQPLQPKWAASALERAHQYGIPLVHGLQALADLPRTLGQALGCQLVNPELVSHGLSDLSAALDQAHTLTVTAPAALPHPTPIGA